MIRPLASLLARLSDLASRDSASSRATAARVRCAELEAKLRSLEAHLEIVYDEADKTADSLAKAEQLAATYRAQAQEASRRASRLEAAIDGAGLRYADSLHGEPRLWCKECRRDSGYHWEPCSRLAQEMSDRVERERAAAHLAQMQEAEAERDMSAARAWAEHWRGEHDDKHRQLAAERERLHRIRAILDCEGPCGETGCTTVATCELRAALVDHDAPPAAEDATANEPCARCGKPYKAHILETDPPQHADCVGFECSTDHDATGRPCPLR